MECQLRPLEFLDLSRARVLGRQPCDGGVDRRRGEEKIPQCLVAHRGDHGTAVVAHRHISFAGELTKNLSYGGSGHAVFAAHTGLVQILPRLQIERQNAPLEILVKALFRGPHEHSFPAFACLRGYVARRVKHTFSLPGLTIPLAVL